MHRLAEMRLVGRGGGKQFLPKCLKEKLGIIGVVNKSLSEFEGHRNIL